MSAPATARTLPHSIEAEEYLLSCCLLDGTDVLARCIEARIRRESFYDSRHGEIFSILIDLQHRRLAIDVAVVAEELKGQGKLDQLGGYPFLTQISGRMPTTAQATYYIDKVRDYSRRREAIRASNIVIEQACDLGASTIEIASLARDLADGLTSSHLVPDLEMHWDDLLAFDRAADPDCLMGNRFLGRSGSCVIVAPSGVGKSVLAYQLAACATLGRPFFGLQMRLRMRVLYVQAEDDHGDVSEAVQGFRDGIGLTKDDLAELKKRLRIVRWNDAAGDKFLARLRAEHAKWPFDLVIINPLFSFCGCNVSDQKEMSAFLRNGLNPILNETRAAAVVVHHTNKPPTDPKNQPGDAGSDQRYLGSGSAELTNWARCYITLQGVKSAGDTVHKMIFAKRGKRAGIVDADGKPTTHVLIEHSPRGLCWLPSDYAPEKDEGGKFKPKFSIERARHVYDDGLDWSENERLIAHDQGMSTRAVRHYKNQLETAA